MLNSIKCSILYSQHRFFSYQSQLKALYIYILLIPIIQSNSPSLPISLQSEESESSERRDGENGERHDGTGIARRENHDLGRRRSENMEYRQTGWIGTIKVNRDAGLEPGEILFLCLSRLEPRVPCHLHCPDPPRLTVDGKVKFSFDTHLRYATIVRRPYNNNTILICKSHLLSQISEF